jgi:hypothetical protein
MDSDLAKSVSSRTRLENFQRHAEPFRRRAALTECAHLNPRPFHKRFIHPGDSKTNNRFAKECGLNRLRDTAAMLGDIENVPDFQPNMRQSAEIHVTMKRHLLEALLQTDYLDDPIR